MRKFSIVLMVLMFSATVSGAVIEDVRVEDGFDSSLTGGDTVEAAGSFTNAEVEASEFAAVLSVSAENMTVSGREFSEVSFSLNEESSECREPIQQKKSVVYRCGLSSIVEEGENSFLIEVETVPYLMPGNYSFDMELKSEFGLGSENVSARVNASSPQTLEVSNVNVTVNASSDATAEVQSFDAVTVPAPEGASEFAGAASVEVRNKSSEVPSSGEVTFTYEEENLENPESNLDVYFYNETTQLWDLIDSELEGGLISADVDHFSTYAAFAEEEESEDSSSGGSSAFTSTSNQDAEKEEETSDQTQSEQTDGDQEAGQEENQEQDNQTQGQQDTEETRPEDNQQQSRDQGITGQFLGSPTNIGGLIVGLLVAMIAALQYFGKVEIRAVLELVREKLEEVR